MASVRDVVDHLPLRTGYRLYRRVVDCDIHSALAMLV